MSDGLFREEALRHHTGGRASGDLLRVPPAWVRSTFALLAAALLAAVAFAAWGSVAVYARGVARVQDGGTVLVFFPERDRARILPGRSMRLVDPSDPKRVVRATVGKLRPEAVPLHDALERLGIAAWPGSLAPSRLASGDGEIAPDPSGVTGTVTAGEILAVEAPAGETSLFRLLVPAGRGSGHDG
jgi:uncharacterized membrane protein